MEIKYLEWNLHAMGGIGYEIPSFISNYINSVDIFVLVEFCTSNGWGEFKHDIGLTYGGIVNQTLGWRYIFVLLVPVLIITLISIRLCSLQEL